MLKKIAAFLLLIILPLFCESLPFSLDAYAEKAEAASKEIMKEVTWSSIKTREELLLDYISGKDKTEPLKLFYCTKQIIQKREESVPEIVKILAGTENEEKFAGLALPFIYTRDRRVIEPLKNIVENKDKPVSMRGLSAAILAAYAKNENYTKERWKVAKQIIYTSDFLQPDKDELKSLLSYVDELKFRDDIGVDMFMWIKPRIFDFVQPLENAELLKDSEKKEKCEQILREYKSEVREKRENAVYALLNLPFPGRDKLLESISNTDSDSGLRKSARLYYDLIKRLKTVKAPQ